uniref:Cj81-133 n=1 Tax=Campylobacter jejuni TaxID=197 RepID=Q50FT0_CAMJU|nr:Cj81-133 [Campylobacter jejuni subsp. jejuni 81-176]
MNLYINFYFLFKILSINQVADHANNFFKRTKFIQSIQIY